MYYNMVMHTYVYLHEHILGFFLICFVFVMSLLLFWGAFCHISLSPVYSSI